jgi:transcriptional regulator with XRE-family HTH domain
MTLNKYAGLFSRAKRSVAYWARVAMRDFTEDLLSKMRGPDMNNAALAAAAGVSPAYITKVMRGAENFTLETMAKLALAVGCKVRIHIAPLTHETYWVDMPTSMTTTVVKNPDDQDIDASIKVGFVGSTGSSLVYAAAA